MSDTFSSNSELILMSYDILRTLTMQIVVQALVVSNNTGISFLNMDFIQITLFLILGTMVFWMVIYKYFSKNNIIENYLMKRD
tara:strand:+ start:338 stop:586 length:249 start_codon:yes stop_codon:yes gene_type:complete